MSSYPQITSAHREQQVSEPPYIEVSEADLLEGDSEPGVMAMDDDEEAIPTHRSPAKVADRPPDRVPRPSPPGMASGGDHLTTPRPATLVPPARPHAAMRPPEESSVLPRAPRSSSVPPPPRPPTVPPARPSAAPPRPLSAGSLRPAPPYGSTSRGKSAMDDPPAR